MDIEKFVSLKHNYSYCLCQTDSRISCSYDQPTDYIFHGGFSLIVNWIVFDNLGEFIK